MSFPLINSSNKELNIPLMVRSSSSWIMEKVQHQVQQQKPMPIQSNAMQQQRRIAELQGGQKQQSSQEQQLQHW